MTSDSTLYCASASEQIQSAARPGHENKTNSGMRTAAARKLADWQRAERRVVLPPADLWDRQDLRVGVLRVLLSHVLQFHVAHSHWIQYITVCMYIRMYSISPIHIVQYMDDYSSENALCSMIEQRLEDHPLQIPLFQEMLPPPHAFPNLQRVGLLRTYA